MICVKETYTKMRTRKETRVIDKEQRKFFFFLSMRVSHLSLLLPFASYSEAVCPLIKVFFVYLVRVNAGKRDANEIHEQNL